MKNVLKALHLLVASNEIKEVGESLENKTENVNAVRTTIQQYIPYSRDTNTYYYSENQVFGGVTIRVLCSKMGCS